MPELALQDLLWAVRRLPKALREVMKVEYPGLVLADGLQGTGKVSKGMVPPSGAEGRIMDDIYISKIRLTNVRCLKEVEIGFGRKPSGQGQLVEIIGDNETGKSSIADMTLKIWEGGSEPSLIRHGASAAEGTMVFSDGTIAVRTQTMTKSELTIVGPDGATKKAPATYLKEFGSWFSRDPLAFDDASPKDRLKILLEISPVRFEPAGIEIAVGRDVAKLIPIPTDVLDLQGFRKFVSLVTERRALIGGQRDEKSSSIEALRKTLPTDEEDGTPKDWAAELARIDGQVAEIDRKEKADVKAITDAVAPKHNELQGAIRTREDSLNKEFAALVGYAREGRKEEIKDTLEVGLLALAGLYGRLTILHEGEAESIQEVKTTAARDREAIAATRGEAQAGRDQKIKAGAVVESIQTFQAAAVRLTAIYDALAAAAKELEKLRKTKVDGALMPGLEVREDGSIWMNQIDWDAQNTATRLMKSIELCSRGTGERWDGFMACDGGERLGPARKEEFRKAVVASGMQALLFTVASKEWMAGCEACGTDGSKPNPSCPKHASRGGDIRSVPAGVLKVKK
jgi:hypothetical protein